MRAFFFVAIVAVALFATAFADQVERRSLRVGASDDDTEERGGFGSLKSKLSAAKNGVKKYAKQVKINLKQVKADAKQTWKDYVALNLIAKGESRDTVLAKMGVKPLSTDAKGVKIYDPNDPWLLRYEALVHYHTTGVLI